MVDMKATMRPAVESAIMIQLHPRETCATAMVEQCGVIRCNCTTGAVEELGDSVVLFGKEARRRWISHLWR